MVSDLDIEKFIEAVRSRPPLWNKLDPMHRNLDLTNKLWNGIVDEMACNVTVAELKQKWHNLRDCFRREVRTTQAGKKKRRWIYYNQMLFLLTPQFIKLNVQKSNAHEFVVQDGALFPIKIEAPDEISQLELTNSDSNNSELENVSHENATETREDCSPLKNCQTETANDESANTAFCEIGEHSQHRRIQMENKNSKIRPQGIGESNMRFRIPVHDDDYHFAMSIVPHMRQIPMHRKLRMRIKISEIIAQETGYDETSSGTLS